MNKAKDVSKLVRQVRKSLGLNGESQQKLLRQARAVLGLTNDELAQALGVKLPTLLSYLAPKDAAKHRSLPSDLRLVLERLIEGQKAKKRRT